MRSQIESIDYWRALNPQCTITDDPWPLQPGRYPVSSANTARYLDSIRTEGYFQTEPLVPAADLDVLGRCIENVYRAGHSTTYALLYDQFYHVLAGISDILIPLLGQGYQMVPDEFEAYYIPTDDDAAGSGPHRDSLRPLDIMGADGLPKMVNVWIAITDATHLNSCIHVMPAHLDPGYVWGPAGPAPAEASEYPLQNVRAVPARAGSVLCWSPHLLHWGGRSSRLAAQPRLSFAVYFQSREIPPVHPTTLDIPSAIPFERRLYLTEKVWRSRQ